MRYFPFFVDLRGRTILVVGGGIQASSKVRLLARTEAEIRLVSPSINADLEAFVARGRVAWRSGCFAPEDLSGVALVYAATHLPQTNREIGAQARKRGIWVAAVDLAEASDLLTPALVDRDPVVVAIGTEGNCPVFARQIKSRIEALLPPTTGAFATFAGRLRSKALSLIPNSHARRRFWSRLVEEFSPMRAGEAAPVLAPEDLEARATRLMRNDEVPACEVHVIGVAGEGADLSSEATSLLHDAEVIVYDIGIPRFLLDLARREATFIEALPGYALEEAMKAHLDRGTRLLRFVLSGRELSERRRLSALGFPVADLLPTQGSVSPTAAPDGHRA